MDRISLIKREHGKLVMFIARNTEKTVPEEVKEIVNTETLDKMKVLAKKYIERVSKGGDRSFLRPMQELLFLIEYSKNFNESEED
jgi:hypothetical protein